LNAIGRGGDSGGGGAGRPVGVARLAGVAIGNNGSFGGQASNGDTIGNGGLINNAPLNPPAENGGNWGQSTTTALAGKGVVDSGATVTFYGADASRYINGTGSHP